MSKKKKYVELKDNQLLLMDGKVITFNHEQYDGIRKIREWLRKKNSPFFTLSGYAGTGKTTCIKKILDEYHGSIVVSAPTHKAKKVITRLTGMHGETLHALLGLRPDLDLDDFNPNNPEFHPISLPKIFDYDLVIIDEASMINQDFYDKIADEIKNKDVKILFMGDPAQIPPIGEKESAVFNQQTNEFHQLTIIERQNDSNPLSVVYDSLRNNLTEVNGGYIKSSQINTKGEGVVFTNDKKEFRNRIISKYKTEDFKKSTEFAKVIAWRNKTVASSNMVIRSELFGENSGIIEIGDVLMAYRSIRSTNNRYNFIENSTDYKVIEKEELTENKYGIKGYPIKIKEDGNPREKSIFIVDFKDIDNLNLYAGLHDHFKEIGKKKQEINSWEEYYLFRRNNILLVNITKHKNGLPRQSFEIISKDMDYGMAITAHKAQGSTYTHVFVIESDIDVNPLIKERNQLKYTSFTRPTTSATILTN